MSIYLILLFLIFFFFYSILFRHVLLRPEVLLKHFTYVSLSLSLSPSFPHTLSHMQCITDCSSSSWDCTFSWTNSRPEPTRSLSFLQTKLAIFHGWWSREGKGTCTHVHLRTDNLLKTFFFFRFSSFLLFVLFSLFAEKLSEELISSSFLNFYLILNIFFNH